MEAWLAAAGAVTVGAITPGPNNLLVLRAATRAGLRGALAPIVGVVVGGLTLVGLVSLGGGALFAKLPHARSAVTVAGSLYLAWLGAALVAKASRRGSERPDASAGGPESARGLFAFQFLNPKSWVLTLTTVSVIGNGHRPTELLALAVLFLVIPTLCLLVWACAGTLLTSALRRRRFRAAFDGVMGTLLIASALLLLLEATWTR